MQSDPWHLWGGNPMMILGTVLERTESLTEHMTELRSDVSEIKGKLIVGDGRMTQLETAQKAQSVPPPHWTVALIKEVWKSMSPREWLYGAILVSMAMKGIFTAAEIKAFMLTKFGIGPI